MATYCIQGYIFKTPWDCILLYKIVTVFSNYLYCYVLLIVFQLHCFVRFCLFCFPKWLNSHLRDIRQYNFLWLTCSELFIYLFIHSLTLNLNLVILLKFLTTNSAFPCTYVSPLFTSDILCFRPLFLLDCNFREYKSWIELFYSLYHG